MCTYRRVSHQLYDNFKGSWATDVVPRHTRCVHQAQPAVGKLAHILPCTSLATLTQKHHRTRLEVQHTRIVVVLPREQRLGKVRGVHVRERVRVSVPTTEAQVEPADARAMLVDDNDLLVVRPELDVVCTSQ